MDTSLIRKVAVLGAGESGTGAAVLASLRGYEVFVSDMGTIAPEYASLLQKYRIPYESGAPHTAHRILDADVVVKSPGIPPTAPLVRRLMEQGTPVVSEIEFAGWFTHAKMVCITGSNGKTTTTMLTHHMLTGAGIDASPAGNVGKSLALQVATDPHEVYVVELSSFQLENMYDFKADIAIMLNITPDHMDRYGHSMERYADAKFRILRNMGPEDAFIYWHDDPLMQARIHAMTLPMQVLPFSATATGGMAAWTAPEGMMHVRVPGHEPWQMPRTDMTLEGTHNLYNSMAASLAATRLGLTPDQCRRALATFRAVEHRLEYVATVRGVRWINDSKATNVDSTWYALEAMATPVILILGGKDKGNDYTRIEELVRKKVRAVVCMGVDNAKLLAFWSGRNVPVHDTHSLEQAVATCDALAQQGDTVLLSPCCASFDLFNSYEHRGQLFKEAVKRLGQ